MVDFEEIDKARKLLQLGETSSLKDIKSSYRRLAQLYHPDKHDNADIQKHESMKKINQAYAILMTYCENYVFSFKPEESSQTHSEEEYNKKWRDNWPF